MRKVDGPNEPEHLVKCQECNTRYAVTISDVHEDCHSGALYATCQVCMKRIRINFNDMPLPFKKAFDDSGAYH